MVFALLLLVHLASAETVLCDCEKFCSAPPSGYCGKCRLVTDDAGKQQCAKKPNPVAKPGPVVKVGR